MVDGGGESFSDEDMRSAGDVMSTDNVICDAMVCCIDSGATSITWCGRTGAMRGTASRWSRASRRTWARRGG